MRYNWKRANRDNLKESLYQWDWRSAFKDNVDHNYNLLTTKLHEEIEINVPKYKLRSKARPPWLNNELKREIRNKRRLWKKHQTMNNNNTMTAYRLANTKLRNSIRKTKKRHETKLANDFQSNSSKFYKYVKSKNNTNTNIGPLKEGNTIFTDSEQMANILNKFFVSVFTREDTNSLPIMADIKDCIQPIVDISIEKKYWLKKLRT